ncbi:glycosyltransferase [Rhizobacter sp. Root1221]|uniref:glycosyltransferase n=1 Tax=Rhizobacter sp. Root1221 TaxID=1736433 RepID=UPI0006F80B22|nr:hypothetical protein [Rhizobacter sp. Root1221]KQV92818.1 hypothetical protein ASC87_27525 [Rhizobacter sp. Root1221]
MAKIMLAWEAGSFLGHEALVTASAVMLHHAGHEVVVCPPADVPPNEAAQREGIAWQPVSRAPGHFAPSVPARWRSRATALWAFGMHSSAHTADRFHAWTALLHRERPDVAVLQAAPYAQLAVRHAGVPSLEFGIGFDVPPRVSPFPAFRHGGAFDLNVALALERTMVENVRRVCPVPEGTPLHALVSGDRRLVVSAAELDHYGGHEDSTRHFCGPLPLLDWGSCEVVWKATRPRVLAYVQASAIDPAEFLKAAGQLQGDVVVICADADGLVRTLAEEYGVRLFAPPISVRELLPSADLVICHGGGMIVEALVRGRRCLALPIHHEQAMTASRLAGLRLAGHLGPRQATHYAGAMRRLLADRALVGRLGEFEKRHRHMATRSVESFVAAVASLVAGARPGPEGAHWQRGGSSGGH